MIAKNSNLFTAKPETCILIPVKSLKDIRKLIVFTVVNKTIQTNVKFNRNHGSLEIIYMALQL